MPLVPCTRYHNGLGNGSKQRLKTSCENSKNPGRKVNNHCHCKNAQNQKEKGVAEGVLSSETVELLKEYLKIIRKSRIRLFFGSNGNAYITEEEIHKMLLYNKGHTQRNT